MPQKKKGFEPCFTRTTPAGGRYITCVGTQNKTDRKKLREKAKRKQEPKKAPAKKAPPKKEPAKKVSRAEAESRARKFIASFPKEIREDPNFESELIKQLKKMTKK